MHTTYDLAEAFSDLRRQVTLVADDVDAASERELGAAFHDALVEAGASRVDAEHHAEALLSYRKTLVDQLSEVDKTLGACQHVVEAAVRKTPAGKHVALKT